MIFRLFSKLSRNNFFRLSKSHPYDNIPDSVEIPDLEEVPHIIEGRDLETHCWLNRNSKTQQ